MAIVPRLLGHKPPAYQGRAFLARIRAARKAAKQKPPVPTLTAARSKLEGGNRVTSDPENVKTPAPPNIATVMPFTGKASPFGY